MEDLMLPFFHLKDDEVELAKTQTKPWWKFWAN